MITPVAPSPSRLAPADFEPVIGLEVHAQLLTKSKMFCSCPAEYQGREPNTTVCPVCLGMPGVLPVINQQAVAFTVMTGLALHCTIAQQTHFDRKNYPYPDLMKGYQISQYADPISHDGWLEIEGAARLELAEGRRRIGIIRVHLEEDVAKLFHLHQATGDAYSLLDVNRSGVPLMEIVSEPDIRSPEEARLYLIKLRAILQYLGVSSGDMEKGAFRCDANVSIRPRGSSEFGPKVEVKNMNSLRSVARALQYEVERQVRTVLEGGRVVQETRGWLEEKGVTISQRTKEYAHDYRYFPEPDLPPLVLSRVWVEELRAQLPELPDARRDRYTAQLGLSRYDASLLTASKAVADFFEACLAIGFPDVSRLSAHPELASPEPSRRVQGRAGQALQKRAKALANWLNVELARLLNQSGKELAEAQVTPQGLMELQDLVEEGAITSTQARALFEELFQTGGSPRQMVAQRGLAQVKEADALAPAVEEAVTGSPQAVQDYLKGKETALRFLIGQVMKATKGKANPQVAADLLKQRLEALRTR